jgi:hypothetical protein
MQATVPKSPVTSWRCWAQRLYDVGSSEIVLPVVGRGLSLLANKARGQWHPGVVGADPPSHRTALRSQPNQGRLGPQIDPLEESSNSKVGLDDAQPISGCRGVS